jgi:signal transduction histidine kinase
MTESSILIVDDDPALLQALPEALQLRIEGIRIDTADSAPAALERIKQVDYDAIISDIKMPGMDGLALLKEVRALRPETPTLLITGHGEHDLAIQALRGGAYDFIQKPIDRDYVVAALQRAIEKRGMSRMVQEQRLALERHALTLEETVQARTRELETIIESMADGVFVCDTTGAIVRVNASGVALLGAKVEQAIYALAEHSDQHLFSDLGGSPLPIEDYPLAQALQGITRTDYRLMIPRFDTGERRQIRVSAAPIRSSAGEITGAVAVASDITQIYQLERQKDDFLSIASHELRTPLTSLKALTQLTRRQLERSGSPAAAHLARMEHSIVRMEQLINDLLDVSRIEAGKLAIRPEPCQLQRLCQQVIDEQVMAMEHAVRFDAPREPLEAEVDVDRLSQVLTNLLSNAFKYSPPDCPVTLTLRQEGEMALFSVHDEGSGIPPEELAHIFDRFYRVPGIEVQRGSGVGLGLGLYICREIVERHGGKIWAESSVGQGSTFFVVLPLAGSLDQMPTPSGHDRSASGMSDN